MKALLALAALVAAGTAAQAQPLVVMRALKTERYVAPAVSAAFTMSGGSGRVRIAVQAGVDGRPAEWLVLAYSHRDLAVSTVEALREWRFVPVTLDGQQVAAQTEFDIEFKGADVISLTPDMDQLDLQFRRMGLERLEYRPCPLRELDRIPLPLSMPSPFYSKEARERGIRGGVDVLFYIDESGSVRMPVVVNADHLELAESALTAVRQWKFEAPTRNGQPVLVAAVQRFEFGRN